MEEELLTPSQVMNVYWQASEPEDERRRHVYNGAIFLDADSPQTRRLADFARGLLLEQFAPLAPQLAQFALPVEHFVEIADRVKSTFTNHPQTKALLVDLLSSKGVDLQQTYFDVPRLRIVTADGYLTAGVGYAYKPHRDTWYAAPDCQINYWLPLADLAAAQALVFYPFYFDRSIPNTSGDFDYQAWQMCGRPQAKAMITHDSRNHPIPLEPPEVASELRFVTPAGHLTTFSAAHLHATAENTAETTRFSIDFRTFDLRDLQARRGAHNCDSAAIGTTVGDFLRAADGAPFTLNALTGTHV